MDERARALNCLITNGNFHILRCLSGKIIHHRRHYGFSCMKFIWFGSVYYEYHCSGSSIIWTGIHFGQISTSKSFHWNHVYQSFFFLAKIIKFNPLLSSECEQYQQKMKTVVVSMNLLVYFISKLAMSASFNKLVLKSVSSLIQFCLSCLCLTWDGFCHWIISFALHQRQKWKWSWNWHECRWIQR